MLPVVFILCIIGMIYIGPSKQIWVTDFCISRPLHSDDCGFSSVEDAREYAGSRVIYDNSHFENL